MPRANASAPVDGAELQPIIETLWAVHGPQGWWPADTPFEVMIGAILTQNTSWQNVTRAIARLKSAALDTPEAIRDSPRPRLAEAIRPSGYFNVKAERLQAFCTWYLEVGGEPALRDWSTPAIRAALLGVKGVGPETADDILLYAFHRRCFVIDAYTRRLFGRLGLVTGTAPYETLRAHFETALADRPLPVWQELHALIVAHGKATCRVRPACGACALRPQCAVGRGMDIGETAGA